MKPRATMFKYPFSKKRVLFSCILVAATMGFTFFVSRDPLWILLFFAYTLLLTVIFLVLKLHLYSANMNGKSEIPYAGEEYSLEGKKTLKRPIITLLILLVFALFLPFLLLLFLDPSTWFISITGFVAGINIPEIILYIYAHRIKSHE